MREILASRFFIQYFWIIEITILAGIFYLINQAMNRRLIHAFQQNTKESKRKSEFFKAIIHPARALLGILLISFCLQIIIQRFSVFNYFLFVIPMRNIGFVLCVLWLLFRWKLYFIRSCEKRLNHGDIPIDSFTFEMFGKIFNIAAIFIASLVVLQILGLDIVPLVTFGGVGIAALGFAAKDIFANLVSGFILYATRPFTVKDLIEIPEKNIYGYIEEIGWCLTCVRDLQKKPIFVPNSIFSSSLLVNITRMSHRCMDEKIHIRFSDISTVLPILQRIKDLLHSNPMIDSQEPIYVFFKSFGIYSIEIEIRAYIKSIRYDEYMEIKQNILIAIYDIIITQSAEITYPTSIIQTQPCSN
jgi:MscS family membrane protein